MSRPRPSIATSVFSFLASLSIALTLFAAPAWAAKPNHKKGPGSGSTNSVAGNDISYPQCGSKHLPSGQAFGIVGVNDGIANKPNPCLGPDPTASTSELAWATNSAGGTTQPLAQLYVNTADPGNTVADWPADGTSKNGVTCSSTASLGTNVPSCAYVYGYTMAEADIADLSAAAGALGYSTSASDYNWWLDVETANSWLSGTNGQAMNASDLQGMIDALRSASNIVGVYSTDSMWSAIIGSTDTNDPTYELANLPVWLPGARTQSGAQSLCTSGTSFTGGAIVLAQWVGHNLDYDWSCAG